MAAADDNGDGAENGDKRQVVREVQAALMEETAEQNSVTWSMLLKPSPALKRMLIVGVGVAVSQQVRVRVRNRRFQSGNAAR